VIRLAITVEGESEEDFVNQVLAPYLYDFEVYSTPRLAGEARRRSRRGGNVSIERVASDLATNYHSFDFVTSLVDFYGFKDKGTRTVEQLEVDIAKEVEKRLQSNWDERKVISYVQRHEFEGLLFSQVSGFRSVLGAEESVLGKIERIRAQFSTPEDINDNPDTAPSKRITQIIPRYNKRVNGPPIAQAIGLTTIRRECPRFNRWVARLESLVNPQVTAQ
jgi:hypothetical protein